ncbi:MAG: PPK2 family polyphosphate kinase [Thermoanaerobaculia bacterium]
MSSMKERYAVNPDKRVRLDRLDPADTAGWKKDDAADEKMKGDLETLSDLQNLLYAAGTHAVLIVIQGIDTAGKDGTIRHVFSGVNPQGCRVACFKQPTAVELAHDYLWRIHAQTPGKGEVVVFNRSQYESVLVERVHDLVPKAVWKKRYKELLGFETVLRRADTIVVKFFLNLSKGEQKERLLAREADPKKRWKVNPADWKERKLWDDYQEAFAEMLEKTSSEEAPWIVVPSDQKWFRNLVTAEILLETLEPYRQEWERAVEERGRKAMGTGDPVTSAS